MCWVAVWIQMNRMGMAGNGDLRYGVKCVGCSGALMIALWAAAISRIP